MASLAADEWLTELLARPVYSVVADSTFINAVREGSGAEAALFRELKAGPVFMYAKVAPGEETSIRFLEDVGFHLVDTNITLSRCRDARPATAGEAAVRFAGSQDESAVCALARSSFVYSRFHRDSFLGRQTADTIKEAWTRNFFRGRRGDFMVVATVGEKVVGFLLLIAAPDGLLVIDLIAVEEAFRGRGTGSAMIAFAEAECPGVRSLKVGTQLANLPSLRFYQGLGFTVSSGTYVFHYHKL